MATPVRLSLIVCLLVAVLQVSSAQAATRGTAKERETEFNTTMNKARFYKRIRRAAVALPLYQKALEIRPNNSEAHAGLGWAYWELQQVDEAFSEEYKAIKLDQNNPVAHHHLAVFYLFLGMNPQAADEFRAEYSIDPRRNCHCGPSEGVMAAYPPGMTDFLKVMRQSPASGTISEPAPAAKRAQTGGGQTSKAGSGKTPQARKDNQPLTHTSQ